MRWSQVASQPFVASPRDPLSVPAGTLLAQTASKIAGSWVGHSVMPTGAGSLPVAGDVLVELDHGGLYRGQFNAIPAFDRGSDAPFCAPLRHWRLDSVVGNGISGEIDVPFGAMYPDGGTWCVLPSWQGHVKQLAMNAAATRLQFEFSTSDRPGHSISYDLWRTCAKP